MLSKIKLAWKRWFQPATRRCTKRFLLNSHDFGEHLGPAGRPNSSCPSYSRNASMTYVVTESCIKCKYTDCVDVCPVDCFREGPNMLVIDPDECIECTLCVPE